MSEKIRERLQRIVDECEACGTHSNGVRISDLKALLAASAVHASQDHGKLTAAIRAVETLPQGEAREALTFAVMQWYTAAFVDHSPLTPEERAWAEKVARIREEAK